MSLIRRSFKRELVILKVIIYAAVIVTAITVAVVAVQDKPAGKEMVEVSE